MQHFETSYTAANIIFHTCWVILKREQNCAALMPITLVSFIDDNFLLAFVTLFFIYMYLKEGQLVHPCVAFIYRVVLGMIKSIIFIRLKFLEVKTFTIIFSQQNQRCFFCNTVNGNRQPTWMAIEFPSSLSKGRKLISSGEISKFHFQFYLYQKQQIQMIQ